MHSSDLNENYFLLKKIIDQTILLWKSN